MELVYRSLDATVLSFQSQLEKIAKELHKETPFVDISSPKVFLRRPTYEALDTALVHVFRNALDHGIESPEERIRKGKNPRGIIVIRCELTSKGMHISMSDDGQGLVLKDIREKALLKGILKDSTAAPNEIAECIFHGGLSTASSLTLTSGRGVGMDAVRAAIQNIGGTVNARVQSQQSPAPWTLEIFLPQACIITAGECSIQRQSVRKSWP
jgi:two-component system chemotaxis sensor kinase CheA